MHLSTVTGLLSLLAPALAAPYSPYPLPDGFPNPSASELQKIEQLAGGSFPTLAGPSSISAESAANLRLIAFNEIFEVAYFTDLLANITKGVKGYTDLGAFPKAFVEEALTAVINVRISVIVLFLLTSQQQEQLHAFSANLALTAFGMAAIQPCKYTFPVTSVNEALALAGTFTDLVLGTLQSASYAFASNNDTALVPLVASIIGQEGEQEGWYRLAQGKKPSASPFLTASAGPFAFTALQSFVIPGSCPNINLISADIPTLQPLTITTAMPQAKNSTLDFQIMGSSKLSGMYIAYISGQTVPVVEPIKNVKTANNMTTFSAAFPFQSATGYFSNGLTIAAVVMGMGPFANVSAVADAAVYGPGLIEIN